MYSTEESEKTLKDNDDSEPNAVVQLADTQKKADNSDVGVDNYQNVSNLSSISSSPDISVSKNAIIDKVSGIPGVNNTINHAEILIGLNPIKSNFIPEEVIENSQLKVLWTDVNTFLNKEQKNNKENPKQSSQNNTVTTKRRSPTLCTPNSC